METASVIPSPVAPRRSHAVARLANIIVDPRATFRDVASDPRWLVAFTGVILLRFTSLFAFYRPSTSAAKLIAGLLFQVAATAPLLVVLALVLWTCSRVCGVQLKWLVAFSITVHVYFAYTLATVAFASAAGAVLPATVDVDLRSPPFTNLGMLAPPDGRFLRAILTHVDVRLAYALVLVALGLRASAAGVRVRDATLAAVSSYGALLAIESIGAVSR